MEQKQEKKRQGMTILVIALLVLALVGVGVLGFFGGANLLPAEGEKAEEKETTATPVPGFKDDAPDQGSDENALSQGSAGGVDYEAIYALHDPDEIVAVVDGKEIPWKDYFYMYYNNASYLEQMFQTYQYYGYALGWEDQADAEGHSYAEMMGSAAEQNLRQFLAVESAAEELGAELNAEEEQAMMDEHQENIDYFCGEGATEEELYATLEEGYLGKELYWRVMRYEPLLSACRRTLYGENGEKIDEQQVLDWMEEQGIVSANHILIPTLDLSTYAELDEPTKAEKAVLAQQIAEELQAIEDPQELETRFLELKEQYCADGSDYVFGPGVMVDAFYEGALALEEGQVSDPVLSQYGYHIILRRPLNADDQIFTSEGMRDAKSIMVETLFDRWMQDRMMAQVLEYAPGFEAPNLLDFYTAPVYTY